MKTTWMVLLLFTVGETAFAATIRVPQDRPTIQAAVDAAQPGDRVRVGPGSWCGATVGKRVRLDGVASVIVGCAAPLLDGGPLRVGFSLGAGASGTEVHGFIFDGAGVSNQNTSPLAFGVFARGVDDVRLVDNFVVGTVQAFTNTGGDGWTVERNGIFALTAFTCDGFCGGGSAIVFQQRATSGPRALGNAAERNFISGTIPDGLNEFDMAGVVIYGQDGANASRNLLAIPANPSAQGEGIGVLVSDRCCGEATPFQTSIDSVIVGNDGRASQFVVKIDRDASGGEGNTEGAFIAHNRGVSDINRQISVAARRNAARVAPRWRLFQ